MRFHWSYFTFCSLLFLLQINAEPENKEQVQEQETLLVFQLKVENLIEKITNFVKDYYYEFRNDLKCIPDNATTSVLEIIKKAIDCIEENENDFINSCISADTHTKNFQDCFIDAKNEIKDAINSINESMIACPNNITEKTYQINVTTTFTKTFNIDIKNGLDITRKELTLRKNKQSCRVKNLETDVAYADDDYDSSTQLPNSENEETTKMEEEDTLQNHRFGQGNKGKNKLLSQNDESSEEENREEEFFETPKYRQPMELGFPHHHIPVMDSRKIQKFQNQKFLDLFDSFERR